MSPDNRPNMPGQQGDMGRPDREKNPGDVGGGQRKEKEPGRMGEGQGKGDMGEPGE